MLSLVTSFLIPKMHKQIPQHDSPTFKHLFFMLDIPTQVRRNKQDAYQKLLPNIATLMTSSHLRTWTLQYFLVFRLSHLQATVNNGTQNITAAV